MSNKVTIYKGGSVNAVYPCELEGYKNDGWSDKAPTVEKEAEGTEPKSKTETKDKRGK